VRDYFLDRNKPQRPAREDRFAAFRHYFDAVGFELVNGPLRFLIEYVPGLDSGDIEISGLVNGERVR
jgi:hypothetical protein